MPRYYLNIYSGQGEVLDPEGSIFPNLKAARREVIIGIRSLLVADAIKGRIDLRGRIEVTNADGEIELTVPFDDALEILASDRTAAQRR
jgi:hypothetical protein